MATDECARDGVSIENFVLIIISGSGFVSVSSAPPAASTVMPSTGGVDCFCHRDTDGIDERPRYGFGVCVQKILTRQFCDEATNLDFGFTVLHAFDKQAHAFILNAESFETQKPIV